MEPILVLAVLLLVPLLNVLVRSLRRSLEGPTPQAPGPEVENGPSPERTRPAAPVAQRREARGILPDAPATSPRSAAPRHRPRVRVGSMREARRAIALIAVLGECRGLEPPSRVRRGGERNA